MKYTHKEKIIVYTIMTSSVFFIVFLAFFVHEIFEKSDENQNMNFQVKNSEIVIEETNPDPDPDPDLKLISENKYKNGIYKIQSSYLVPNHGNDTVEFQVEIEDDEISEINIENIKIAHKSKNYINYFLEKSRKNLINKNIDEIENVYISGATLTSNAFNQAIFDIRKNEDQT